jgi:hypothetical protein
LKTVIDTHTQGRRQDFFIKGAKAENATIRGAEQKNTLLLACRRTSAEFSEVRGPAPVGPPVSATAHIEQQDQITTEGTFARDTP